MASGGKENESSGKTAESPGSAGSSSGDDSSSTADADTSSSSVQSSESRATGSGSREKRSLTDTEAPKGRKRKTQNKGSSSVRKGYSESSDSSPSPKGDRVQKTPAVNKTVLPGLDNESCKTAFRGGGRSKQTVGLLKPLSTGGRSDRKKGARSSRAEPSSASSPQPGPSKSCLSDDYGRAKEVSAQKTPAITKKVVPVGREECRTAFSGDSGEQYHDSLKTMAYAFRTAGTLTRSMTRKAPLERAHSDSTDPSPQSRRGSRSSSSRRTLTSKLVGTKRARTRSEGSASVSSPRPSSPSQFSSYDQSKQACTSATDSSSTPTLLSPPGVCDQSEDASTSETVSSPEPSSPSPQNEQTEPASISETVSSPEPSSSSPQNEQTEPASISETLSTPKPSYPSSLSVCDQSKQACTSEAAASPQPSSVSQLDGRGQPEEISRPGTHSSPPPVSSQLNQSDNDDQSGETESEQSDGTRTNVSSESTETATDKSDEVQDTDTQNQTQSCPEITDLITQLQDAVNQQAQNLCSCIGMPLQSANPSQFPGFHRLPERVNTHKPQQDYTGLFATYVVQTAKDIDVLIEALPGEEDLSIESHAASLQTLEMENQESARKLEEVLKKAEKTLAWIRQTLNDIAECHFQCQDLERDFAETEVGEEPDLGQEDGGRGRTAGPHTASPERHS